MLDDTQLLIPDSTRAKIARINGDYLALAQELAQIDSCAAALLGVPQETVKVFETIRTRSLLPLVQSGFLVPQMRIADPAFWRSVAAGEADTGHILHALLNTMREPT